MSPNDPNQTAPRRVGWRERLGLAALFAVAAAFWILVATRAAAWLFS